MSLLILDPGLALLKLLPKIFKLLLFSLQFQSGFSNVLIRQLFKRKNFELLKPVSFWRRLSQLTQDCGIKISRWRKSS